MAGDTSTILSIHSRSAPNARRIDFVPIPALARGRLCRPHFPVDARLCCVPNQLRPIASLVTGRGLQRLATLLDKRMRRSKHVVLSMGIPEYAIQRHITRCRWSQRPANRQPRAVLSFQESADRSQAGYRPTCLAQVCFGNAPPQTRIPLLPRLLSRAQ